MTDTNVTRIIDSRFDEQVAEIQKLCAIPSVSRGEPEDGMPLGRQVHNALKYTLDLAKRLGFDDARSLDGYCGVIDYGTGDETLVIMGHIDVVPAGPDWSSDPFKPEIRNGRIYGRGVIDDKGPVVSALYALHAVREAGIPLKRRVRIFVGCDEEAGWSCVDRYKKTEPEPTLAFTPDGSYPVVNSEMSICHATYGKKLTGSGVRISCGTAANVVPGAAEAALPFDAKEVASACGAKITVDGNRLIVKGRGGHAAMAELAVNALQYLLKALAEQPLTGEDLSTAKTLYGLFGLDQHGESLSLDVCDASGRLSLQPTMLEWTEDGVKFTLDCRHPVSLGGDELIERFDALFGSAGYSRVEASDSVGHYVAPDTELVTTLTDLYEELSGRRLEPLSIGGGTYARAFENAVAFGAEPVDGPEEAHMPDESTGLDEVRFNTVAIAEAIRRLAGK